PAPPSDNDTVHAPPPRGSRPPCTPLRYRPYGGAPLARRGVDNLTLTPFWSRERGQKGDICATRTEGRGLPVLRQVAEGDGAVVARLLGQAEHALAEDVVLDLVGTAVDRRTGREQGHLGDHPRERVAG